MNEGKRDKNNQNNFTQNLMKNTLLKRDSNSDYKYRSQNSRTNNYNNVIN